MTNQAPLPPNRLFQLLYRLDETAYVALNAARETFAHPARRRIAAIGLAVVLLPVLGVLAWRWSRPEEPMTRMQLTSSGAVSTVRGAAISPDGKKLAYADAGGLHLLTLETLGSEEIGSSAGMTVEELAWSPDGERLYFVGRKNGDSSDALWELRLPGGSPQRLRRGARLPAIAPDGTRLAFVEERAGLKSIWVMGADGGDAWALADDERFNHLHPTWMTNERLAFVRVRTDETGAEIVSSRTNGGGATRAVVNFDPRTAPCWTPDGRLVYGRADRSGASLWSVRLDPESGEPLGEETSITEEEGVSYFSELSVDSEGNRLGFVPVRTRLDSYVANLDEAGREISPRRLQSGDGDHWPVAWTDEGESLLVRLKHDGRSEVLLQPVAGGGPRSVAHGFLLARAPDGTVLFEASGQAGLMRARPPEGEPEFLGGSLAGASSSRPVLRCPQSPGKNCVLAVETGRTLRFHVFDPSKDSGQGRELARIGLARPDYGWNVSPDGGRVAVVNGNRKVKLVNLHNGGVRTISIDASLYSQGVAWSASGDSLFVSGMILHSGGGYVLYGASLSGKTRLLWQTTDRWFGEPVPSPDGTRLALSARTVEADAWMLERF